MFYRYKLSLCSKSNIKFFQRIIKTNTELSAVVKSDAYGLGIAKIVPEIERYGVRSFFTATISEAIKIRSYSRNCEIFTLNGFDFQLASAVKGRVNCPLVIGGGISDLDPLINNEELFFLSGISVGKLFHKNFSDKTINFQSKKKLLALKKPYSVGIIDCLEALKENWKQKKEGYITFNKTSKRYKKGIQIFHDFSLTFLIRDIKNV